MLLSCVGNKLNVMRRDILASRDEMKALRGQISHKPFDLIYDMLRKRCAMTLESSPVSEGQWRDVSQRGDAAAALKAARTAQGRIIDLLVAHNIDNNVAYRDRAHEELRNLVSWSAWNEPAAHGQAAHEPVVGAAAQQFGGGPVHRRGRRRGGGRAGLALERHDGGGPPAGDSRAAAPGDRTLPRGGRPQGVVVQLLSQLECGDQQRVRTGGAGLIG